MDGDDEEEFCAFEALHSGALRSSGIPRTYWRSLHRKITGEVCVQGTDVQSESSPAPHV